MKRIATAAVLALAAGALAAVGPATQPARPSAVHIRFRSSPNGYSGFAGGQSAVEARGEDAVSCVLQIDSDTSRGDGGRADAQMAQALLSTTALQDSAVTRMMEKNPDIRGRFTVSASATNYRLVRLEVFPDAGDAAAARAMQAALIESLEAALNASGQASADAVNERRAQLEKDVEAARARLAAAEKKLAASRAPYEGGGYAPSQVYTLASQLRAIESELTAKQARMDAIRDYMKRAATQPSNGAAAATTQPMAAVAAIPVESGTMMPAGTGMSPGFNRPGGYYTLARPIPVFYRVEDELPHLEVAVAELESRRKSTQEEIDKITGGKPLDPMPRSEDYGQYQMEVSQARNDVTNLQSQLENLRRNAPTPVKLTVLDGR